MPPTWQLPPGVSRGTWDYFQSPSIAENYDEYFAGDTLFEFDQQVLREEFDRPGLVADLGCGTGRALVPLARDGHRGLAIDMSPHMLRVVQQKANAERLPIECLQANLTELDAVADNSIDYAMCMFSTLGMIRGHENRRRMLIHVRRMLRIGGRFVLHVHNFWFNLRDPSGPWWVLKSLAAAARSSELEVGDKFYSYRGVPNMFLHVFRERELRNELRRAGFQVRRWIPLTVKDRHALPRPWFLPTLRANGWIVSVE